MTCYRKFIAVSFLVLSGFAALCVAQEQNSEAAQRKIIAQLEKMFESDKQQGDVAYAIAAMYTRLGDTKAALDWLERAVGLRDGLDPSQESSFKPVREDPRFKSIAARAAASVRSKPTSKQEFLIDDPEFIPEGVAWDASGKRLFVGSLHQRRIVAIDSEGKVRDFVKSGQDGIWAVLGMKVDPKRKLLWAGSAADEREGKLNGTAGLFAFDLATGALKHKYVVGNENGKRLLNDMVIDANGDVFVTDSEFGNVMVLRSGSDKLENLMRPQSLIYPNGIAPARDTGKLYVAHFARGGLSLVDKATGAITPIKRADPKMMLEGIDGLYAVDGDLVAVQNGMGIPRVARFKLNAAGDTVTAVEVLDSQDPALEIPTTGAPAGDRFYLIANSQLDQLEKGKIKEGHDQLKSVRIVSVPLRAK